MKKFKGAIVAGILGFCLISSISATASVVLSETIGGVYSETSNVVLGSGGRYLTTSGLVGDGRACAMKVIPLFPDTVQATVWVHANKWGQDYFVAKPTNSSGVKQSYYIAWDSNDSKSKAIVRFQN